MVTVTLTKEQWERVIGNLWAYSNELNGWDEEGRAAVADLARAIEAQIQDSDS